LIDKLEHIAEQTLNKYLDSPARIVATSLGGVIWVELLSRHPEWWDRCQSLVLLGSPLGGAHLARMLTPLGLGLGLSMVKHLAQNRRSLAEQITAKIPTLVVAGNIIGGVDGMVSVQSTQLQYAQFIRLDGVDHWALRYHPRVITVIQEFWSFWSQPQEIFGQ
jgi:pimeloyl-ACP methyl ester carboxylesterase